uniref:beta-1,4-galactosyltransferase 5-like isoform X2 n=1 Tax=Myxine glutinosa TaxID=7769 RepID=UPI00358F1AAF
MSGTSCFEWWIRPLAFFSFCHCPRSCVFVISPLILPPLIVRPLVSMRFLRLRSRSIVAMLFLFSLSSSFLYFIYVAPGLANQYLFMMQASTIKLKENVRTISAQVYEQIRNEGRIDVNMSLISFAKVQTRVSNLGVRPGGHWRPNDCKPRWKVAILIPFRNRHEHLPILLRHLVPMLQRQHLQFAFYLIEQASDLPFNRAMLFNVGYLEALKDLAWDCFVFHDVDHIPENDRNYYGCGLMPRHFAHKLDKYMYILPYDEFFGGVSGLTTQQFKRINGFPNAFWGWGGEDDDLWNRVTFAGYNVSRPPGDIGKYKSIPHHHHGEVQFLGRYKLLRRSKERNFLDGLINLNYTARVSVEPLFKKISVNLVPDQAPISDY